MNDTSTRLVGAVLAGERGDLDRAVDSLCSAGVRAEVFDTTPDHRYRRIARAGVTVTPIAWAESFAAARNAGIDSMVARAVGDVALWIDTDEQLSPPSLDGRDLLDGVARSDYVLCPEIKDSRFSTQGVARLHSLDGRTRFAGRVHEYLVRSTGEPIDYRSIDLSIRHRGYSEWSRVPRNDRMLRQAIVEDGSNPRWRPFWVRDAGVELDPREIAGAIREQARIGPFQGSIGGMTSDDYTRMIAWHGLWNVVDKSPSPFISPALSRLKAIGSEAVSELLYLRIISEAVLGLVSDRLLAEAFDHRRATLAQSDDFPWLDAGICVALDANGRVGEAEAYRSESTPFSDPFCEDSRLRDRFARKQA